MNENEINALKFIVSHTKEKHYPPTVREIGAAIGLSSTSSVHKLLKRCINNGYIEIDTRISRSVRISKSGKKLISAG